MCLINLDMYYQAALEVIEHGALWWAGKELLPEKSLEDYVGKNEKTKIVIKLSKKGGQAPGREQQMTEEQKKHMMAWQYRKQEDMKVTLFNLLFL